MGFKIKNLLRTIKEAQQREAHLEELESRISGYIDEQGHLRYDPVGCTKEYKKAKSEYEDWVNVDLEIETTPNAKVNDRAINLAGYGTVPTSDTDTAEHACNMRILEALKKYLDDNRTIRFGQALVNLGIITNVYIHGRRGMYAEDPFYERPEETYERMKEKNNGFRKSS